MEVPDTVGHLACPRKHSGAYLGTAHSFAGAFLVRERFGAPEALVGEEWAPGQLLVVVAPVPNRQKGPSSC